MLKPENYFDPAGPLFSGIFRGAEYAWEGLRNICLYIEDNIRPNCGGFFRGSGPVKETIRLDNGAVIFAGSYIMDENIQIGPDVVIEPGAYVKGPTILGAGTQVRHGAYIRGNVITGRDCVAGHATEIKHSVLMGESVAGHFAYIGDSILGKVNLGAGTKLANLKITDSSVSVRAGERVYDTGMRKLGAIMGDGCRTGCNSVTMPGTLLSRDVILYPNTSARGFYPPETVIKPGRIP